MLSRHSASLLGRVASGARRLAGLLEGRSTSSGSLAAGSGSTALDPNSDAPYKMVWYHLGTPIWRGKARVGRGERASRKWIERLLREEGEDLTRNAAWVYTKNSFVKLEDLELVDVTEYDDERKVEVRLEPRPNYVRSTSSAKEFFGIGIIHGKTEANLGTLWRSAIQLGAQFCFTVGRRYKPERTDTYSCASRVPVYCATTFAELSRPFGSELVGIEMGGISLVDFKHPARAVYVLGSEDHGLPTAVREACQHIVTIPAVDLLSYNVAVAGSLIMYDRAQKRENFAIHPDLGETFGSRALLR